MSAATASAGTPAVKRRVWDDSASTLTKCKRHRRKLTDGSLDTSFNTSGYVTTVYGVAVCCGVNGDDSDFSLVLQPDNR